VLATLSGHRGPVTSCAYSHDGKWIVSGSRDKTLKLWDADEGSHLTTLSGHRGWVEQVLFSPDGQWILSRALDRTIKLWDTKSGILEWSLTLDGFTQDCVFLGVDRIICACADGTLHILDLQNHLGLLTLTGHERCVHCCVVSGDGRCIASASMDKTLKLWNTQDGRLRKTLSGHEGWVYTCAYSADGKRLLSGSEDQFVKVWDTASGVELFEYWAEAAVRAVTWHPTGERFAAGDSAGRLHLLQCPDQTR
jgi:WD40 repeat protein